MTNGHAKKRNVTIGLSPEPSKKPGSLRPETLVGAEEAYERSARSALALLEEGFHLGGAIAVSRDEWHAR